MTLEYRDIEINFLYCNNIDFTHHHTSVKEATEEYGQLLAEAIEPVGELAEALHIRRITMTFRGDGDEVIHQLTSGIFECEHRLART